MGLFFGGFILGLGIGIGMQRRCRFQQKPISNTFPAVRVGRNSCLRYVVFLNRERGMDAVCEEIRQMSGGSVPQLRKYEGSAEDEAIAKEACGHGRNWFESRNCHKNTP